MLLTYREQRFFNLFILFFWRIIMTKTKLISSFGGAVAVSLLSTPVAQASENPFAMQKTSTAIHLAEGMDMGKGAEGKCGDKMKNMTAPQV